MSIKESTANSLIPAQRFVAGNARFIPGRLSHHAFDPAIIQIHQVARSENAGIAHSSANMNFAVTKDHAASTHRFIMPQVIAEVWRGSSAFGWLAGWQFSRDDARTTYTERSERKRQGRALEPLRPSGSLSPPPSVRRRRWTRWPKESCLKPRFTR